MEEKKIAKREAGELARLQMEEEMLEKRREKVRQVQVRSLH